jgi:hypothetical protein
LHNKKVFPMKKCYKILAIGAIAMMASTAANAQSSAGADAAAASQAGATINEGTNWGGASVGSAYCVDGFALGPIAVSTTIRACIAGEVAAEGGQLGTLTRAEVGAVQRAPTVEHASAPAAQQVAPPAFAAYTVYYNNGSNLTISTPEHHAAYTDCSTGLLAQQLDGSQVHLAVASCG